MRILIAILLLLLSSPAWGTPLKGSCEVFFFGSSTLHDFDGKGACEPFTLEIDTEGKLTSGSLSVPVAGMDTDNDSRDEKMREMFEADKFPSIAGNLQSNEVSSLSKQLHQAFENGGTFPLNLRIRDIDQQQEARVVQLIDSDKAFSVDLEFPLSLETYKLDPPSILFISVADEIKVQVRLHLAPLPTPWQP